MDHAGANLLTTRQVADALNIDRTHVSRLARQHGIGRTLGAATRVFTAADIEAMRAKLKPGAGRPKGR